MLYLTNKQINEKKKEFTRAFLIKYKSFLYSDLGSITDIDEFAKNICSSFKQCAEINTITNPLTEHLYGEDKDTKELFSLFGDTLSIEDITLPIPKFSPIFTSANLVGSTIHIYFDLTIDDYMEKCHIEINTEEKDAFDKLISYIVTKLDLILDYTYQKYNLTILNNMFLCMRDNNSYDIKIVPQFKLNILEQYSGNSVTSDTVCFNVLLDNLKNSDVLYSMYYDVETDEFRAEILHYLNSIQTPLQFITNTPKWINMLVGQKIPKGINTFMKQVYTRNVDNPTKKSNLYYITDIVNGIKCGALIRKGENITDEFVLPFFDLDNGLYVRLEV